MRRLLAILSVALLSACSGGGGGPGSGLFGSAPTTGLACPNVAVLDAAGELTRFAGGSPGSLQDLLFQTRLDVVEAFCEITDKAIFVTIKARLTLARGPAEKTGELPLTFFIAVLDGKKAVILREAVPLIIKLKPDETRFEYEDTFTIQIDRKDKIDASVYSVYGGFEMTPAELEYSRRRRG